MKVPAFLFMVLSSVGLAFPTSAVGKVTKYGGEETRVPASPESTMREFWRFSNCAAKRNLNRTRVLLSHREWGTGVRKLVSAYTKTYRSCLPVGSQMRFNSKLFRGSLAAAYLNHKYKKAAPPNYGVVTPTFTETAFNDLASNVDRPSFLLDAFADCVVRNQPAHAFHLFASKPTGKIEKIIFEQLQPTMRVCLSVKDGDQVEFTTTSLRGLMAEAAYDLDLRYFEDKSEKTTQKIGADS